LDVALAGEAQIVFTAGTHTEAIVMSGPISSTRSGRSSASSLKAGARFDVPLAV